MLDDVFINVKNIHIKMSSFVKMDNCFWIFAKQILANKKQATL